MSDNVISEVALRTKGEIYLGIVGAVRSGKSTFIRRFMEAKVLPLIEDQEFYQKIADELPLSGDGKMVMTVEPKFVPSNNFKIEVGESVSCQIRLVDCVGFVMPKASGYLNEDGSNRLVKTPWFQEEIPFEEAAIIGTKKVIESHSNIGIVVTSDGSFGEFERSDYEEVEAKVIEELVTLNKPFIILLNTKNPNSLEVNELVDSLSQKYNVSVIAVDVANMDANEVDKILEKALDEFEIAEMNILVPDWFKNLSDNVSYKARFNELIDSTTNGNRKMRDIFSVRDSLASCDIFENVAISDINPGTGVVTFELDVDESVYNDVTLEITGIDISDKASFIDLLQEMVEAKTHYQKIKPAMASLNEVGYGLAIPSQADMVLDKPELIKQNGRYGIKLKATAPAIHMVRVDVETTFEPIIGTEEQSQALINHMNNQFDSDIEEIWNSEIFGRKLSDVMVDGIKAKVYNVPSDVEFKYKESLSKVINDGRGGVIAIIL